jgi:hypothetical protein
MRLTRATRSGEVGKGPVCLASAPWHLVAVRRDAPVLPWLQAPALRPIIQDRQGGCRAA